MHEISYQYSTNMLNDFRGFIYMHGVDHLWGQMLRLWMWVKDKVTCTMQVITLYISPMNWRKNILIKKRSSITHRFIILMLDSCMDRLHTLMHWENHSDPPIPLLFYKNSVLCKRQSKIHDVRLEQDIQNIKCSTELAARDDHRSL